METQFEKPFDGDIERGEKQRTAGAANTEKATLVGRFGKAAAWARGCLPLGNAS